MEDIVELINFSELAMGRKLSCYEKNFIFAWDKEIENNEFVFPRKSNGKEFSDLLNLVVLQAVVKTMVQEKQTLEESLNNFIQRNQTPPSIIDVSKVRGGRDDYSEENNTRKYGNRFETMIMLDQIK